MKVLAVARRANLQKLFGIGWQLRNETDINFKDDDDNSFSGAVVSGSKIPS